MLSRQHIRPGEKKMALTGLQFGMTVSFVDNGGNQVTREYMMKTAIATYADAATAAAAMIPLVAALTGATLPQYRVFQVFEESAFVLPGDAGVQVENQASLTLLLSGVGSKKANLNIPAPVSGVFSASSGPNANVVDVNDVAVLAFVDQFKGPQPFRLSDGEAATSLLTGRRVHKRSSRG
jgi:hypothetical protein